MKYGSSPSNFSRKKFGRLCVPRNSGLSEIFSLGESGRKYVWYFKNDMVLFGDKC